MEHPFAASTFQGVPNIDNASTTPLEAHNTFLDYGHLGPITQESSRQIEYNARHLRDVEGPSRNDAGEGGNAVGLRQRTQGASFKLSQLDENLELELHTSWVYSRPTQRHSISSWPSKINSTTGMSFLSVISLARVSNISVFELPVFYHEIWNPQYYNDTKHLAINHGLGRRSVSTSVPSITVSLQRKVSKKNSKDPTTGPRRLLNGKFGLPFLSTSTDIGSITQVQEPKRGGGEDSLINIMLGKVIFLGE